MRSLPGSTTLELTIEAHDADARPSRCWQSSATCRTSSGLKLHRTITPLTAQDSSSACGCMSRVRRRNSSRPPRRCCRARADAERRGARHADARGRVHPSHGKDAAMSAAAASAGGSVSQLRAFRAVLGRDVFVTWSELPVFLAQVILQPLFLLFVFGKVLGSSRLHPARLRPSAVPGTARAHRGDHGHADARLPARDRVRLDQGDRGPAAGADGDRSRRRREGPVRERPRADRRRDHDPDRGRRARLDPVALERLAAARARS